MQSGDILTDGEAALVGQLQGLSTLVDELVTKGLVSEGSIGKIFFAQLQQQRDAVRNAEVQVQSERDENDDEGAEPARENWNADRLAT